MTGKRSTVEEDLRLYDRLITSRPIHASPAEHQATPGMLYGVWFNEKLHGNLPGWRQYRKMLPSEAIADFPAEYLLL